MKLDSVIFAGTNTFAQIGVKHILRDHCTRYDIVSEPTELIKSLNDRITLVVFYLSKGSGFGKELLAKVQKLGSVPILVITADYTRSIVKVLLSASQLLYARNSRGN